VCESFHLQFLFCRLHLSKRSCDDLPGALPRYGWIQGLSYARVGNTGRPTSALLGFGQPSCALTVSRAPTVERNASRDDPMFARSTRLRRCSTPCGVGRGAARRRGNSRPERHGRGSARNQGRSKMGCELLLWQTHRGGDLLVSRIGCKWLEVGLDLHDDQ